MEISQNRLYIKIKAFARNSDGTWNRDNVVDTINEVFSGFVVEIKLKRIPYFYVYNMLVPVLINSVLGTF